MTDIERIKGSINLSMRKNCTMVYTKLSYKIVNINETVKNIMTQWFSEKLQFAIKIINHSDEDMVLELRNIKEGPQDPSLFKVPEDYQQMNMSGQPVDK
ncbi:MAG: DUF4412 domain-containing protein [Bacteroidetes bacterium]|nr:DUF4412 domain-containing protein [Bacteroidota bacterium]